jgi:hypothetical protein
LIRSDALQNGDDAANAAGLATMPAGITPRAAYVSPESASADSDLAVLIRFLLRAVAS